MPDDSVSKKVPDNKSMENAQIGLVSVAGKNNTDYYPQQGSYGVDTGIATAPPPQVTAGVSEPFTVAEIMPEFPGGNGGLIKFMLRNLKEADDLNTGERVVVQARFVVEADGRIDNIEIQNTSSRYDAEVIRVIKKMPQWKPGMQNGLHVPVYLTLPVTFQGKDE